jgi:hypothetical protein
VLAARSLNLEAQLFDVRTAEALPGAFDQAAKEGVGALLATGSDAISTNMRVMNELAAEHRLPVVYPNRAFVDAGGLIS